jgi:uncharacterized membrane protein YeaQ/YmgE (transglycosylase-associated protein family)
MSWIIAIIVGAIVGWIANSIMRTDGESSLLWDVIVGIVGGLWPAGYSVASWGSAAPRLRERLASGAFCGESSVRLS